MWPQSILAGEVWEQVGGMGLGDPNNTFIPTMETWNNAIYAGIGNYVVGARIYRSTDGNTWTKVNTDGFGHVALSTIMDFQSFNGRLYASTFDDNTPSLQPAEIWSSADGITWTQSGNAGLGHNHNTGFMEMTEFGGQLYVGSRNETDGAEIYRTADGTTWNLVADTAGGFGVAANTYIWGMYSYDGFIWAGTWNNNGAQVWRSANGADWDIYRNFAPFITGINHFFEFNNMLQWFGMDVPNGASITRRLNDITTETYIGFTGDPNDIWYSFNSVVSGGLLYGGTRNLVTGGALWYTSDGINLTQIGLDGFGNVDSFAIYALTFKDYLYIGLSTGNGLKGIEIWRRVYTADFAITTKSLKNAEQGSAYSSYLAASGGSQPLTWSVASGNLPKGLSLNSATGEISGTPQESGDFRFIIEVQDSGKKQQKAQHVYTLKIVAGATDISLANVTVLPQTGAEFE